MEKHNAEKVMRRDHILRFLSPEHTNKDFTKEVSSCKAEDIIRNQFVSFSAQILALTLISSVTGAVN